MLFFADSGERAVVAGAPDGHDVVSVITSILLLLTVLNDPFHEGVGGLRPVAMERALQVIDEELRIDAQEVSPPCDARGMHCRRERTGRASRGRGAGRNTRRRRS